MNLTDWHLMKANLCSYYNLQKTKKHQRAHARLLSFTDDRTLKVTKLFLDDPLHKQLPREEEHFGL